MAIELLTKHDLFAFVVKLVLIGILALLHQVIIKLRDLDYLFTLPAGRQHRTLFPVVKIDRLWVKWFIIATTKIANLVLLNWLFLFYWLGLSLRCFYLLFLSGRLLLFRLFESLGSSWVDISCYIYHRFFILKLSLRLANAHILKGRLNCVNLGLPQFCETLPNFVTHNLVQFNDALRANLTYVL